MILLKKIIGMALVSSLVACGGGGGNAGSTSTGGSAGSTTTAGSVSTTGNVQVTIAGTLALEIISGAGAVSNSISALEIAQAKITLTDSKGGAVSGVVVTFSESGGGLLSISPASKTALTDSSGQASVEIKASTSTSIGATQINASASVSSQSLSATKALQISSAPTSGPVVSPQDLANAINFLDTNPSDKSIVLAGAGGSGRSESATLRFRVVDKNNTPVKGTVVSFNVIPAAAVTLNISSATSDSDGVVVTTVSSKSTATAVVVKATVNTKTISTQSDTLLVTTGPAVAAGFDLSATKFNMNSELSGDLSEITVRVVDGNGNRVADGVPVVFTASHGAVGSSSRGGCVTANGECKVDYIVQNPRPADGTDALVTASTQVGSGIAVSGTANFVFSRPSLLDIYDAATAGITINPFTWVGGGCKFTLSGFIGTPAGSPAPANTSIAVKSLTSDFAVTVKSDSTILDRATARTPVTFEFDATSTSLVPNCNLAGVPSQAAQFEVKLTAGTIVKTLVIGVAYPN